jgi:hypothetical protein
MAATKGKVKSSSSGGGKFAKGGKGHMFGYTGSKVSKSGVTK